jgi:hypothetical protein
VEVSLLNPDGGGHRVIVVADIVARRVLRKNILPSVSLVELSADHAKAIRVGIKLSIIGNVLAVKLCENVPIFNFE